MRNEQTLPADPMMTAIGEAITLGRSGKASEARRRLTGLWSTVGADGDPLHRCTLAHHLADLYDHPAEALAWDIRALDAADALTDARAREHHATLRVAGFYPSLHLNLADNYRRLGAFDAAHRHITAAAARADSLGDDGYGRLIRTAIAEVGTAIRERSTKPRASAPNSGPG